MSNNTPLRVAVLISGGGTTLRNLIEKKKQGKLDAQIELVISSNPLAAGLGFAGEAGIPRQVIDRKEFETTESFGKAIFFACRTRQIDLVVMGGFLKRVLIPVDFENRVINIHPSLIPQFCGHGFYGTRVHAAVIESGVESTGCTVHFVDDEYDHGPIIAQQEVPVRADDTPQILAARVFEAECEIYPHVINAIARGQSANPS